MGVMKRTLKLIEQHRDIWPQVYEYLINGTTTKFHVMCRKAGYQGVQVKKFKKLKDAKAYASAVFNDVKTKGVAEAGITANDRHWILEGKRMLAPFGVTLHECFTREVAYQLELQRRNTFNTIRELRDEWIVEKFSGKFEKNADRTLKGLRNFSERLAVGYLSLKPERQEYEAVKQTTVATPQPKPDNFVPDLGHLVMLSPGQLEGMDIATMNLACAEGLPGNENLNVTEALQTLDMWASHVREETERNLHRFKEHPEESFNSESYWRAAMLITVLQQDFGVHYNLKRMQDMSMTHGEDVLMPGLLSDLREGPPAQSLDTSLGVLISKKPEELEQTDIATLYLASRAGLPGAENVDLERTRTRFDTLAKIVQKQTEATYQYQHHLNKNFQNTPEAKIAVMMDVLRAYEQEGDRRMDTARPENLFLRNQVRQEQEEQHFASPLQAAMAGQPYHPYVPRPEDSIPEVDHTVFNLNNPMLIVAIGQSLGYPLYLVKAPDHMFARWQSPDGKTLFDIDEIGKYESNVKDPIRYDNDYDRPPKDQVGKMIPLSELNAPIIDLKNTSLSDNAKTTTADSTSTDVSSVKTITDAPMGDRYYFEGDQGDKRMILMLTKTSKDFYLTFIRAYDSDRPYMVYHLTYDGAKEDANQVDYGTLQSDFVYGVGPVPSAHNEQIVYTKSSDTFTVTFTTGGSTFTKQEPTDLQGCITTAKGFLAKVLKKKEHDDLVQNGAYFVTKQIESKVGPVNQIALYSDRADEITNAEITYSVLMGDNTSHYVTVRGSKDSWKITDIDYKTP